MSISPTAPVSLYGRSMQLVAVEVCYTATTSALLSFVEVNVETAVNDGGTRTVVFADATDATNAACRYVPLPTPRTLTANDTVNLFVGGEWAVANSTLVLGRASFIFAPTSTTLTPPSDIAPSTPPVAVPATGTSTAPPRP